jgi:hypothetical protein
MLNHGSKVILQVQMPAFLFFNGKIHFKEKVKAQQDIFLADAQVLTKSAILRKGSKIFSISLG